MNGRTRTRGCRDAYPDYRGFRIEVEPVVTGMRWNETVRILRLFSEDETHVNVVTCLKLTPRARRARGRDLIKAMD
jgi:hypothetical protein